MYVCVLQVGNNKPPRNVLALVPVIDETGRERTDLFRREAPETPQQLEHMAELEAELEAELGLLTAGISEDFNGTPDFDEVHFLPGCPADIAFLNRLRELSTRPNCYAKIKYIVIITDYNVHSCETYLALFSALEGYLEELMSSLTNGGACSARMCSWTRKEWRVWPIVIWLSRGYQLY